MNVILPFVIFARSTTTLPGWIDYGWTVTTLMLGLPCSRILEYVFLRAEAFTNRMYCILPLVDSITNLLSLLFYPYSFLVSYRHYLKNEACCDHSC
jgi:hypothetical protein